MRTIVFSYLLSAWAGATTPELVCQSSVHMGTEFKICVYASSKDRLNATQDIQSGFQALEKINSWMSDWIPGTELNQINENSGVKAVKVSRELFELLSFSQKISAATEGAYDPTFNAFWGLYNFKPGQEREPTDQEISERLPLINYRDLVLDPKNQTAMLKKTGQKIGLGAIGQGYGVDQVVRILKQRGYSAGYVDGSGDTYFWGSKPDGKLWTAGVRDPNHHEKTISQIYGTDIAVTTAGDDEKYFMKGDRRIHHILDPRTGRSADKSRQVTVIAKTALEADAFDTACFVLGWQKCDPLLKKYKLSAIVVSNDGITHKIGTSEK